MLKTCQKEFVKSMITNDLYKTVVQDCENIKLTRDRLAGLNADMSGFGEVVPKDKLDHAAQVQSRGMRYASVAWALFQLLVTLPRINNPTAQKEEARKLQDFIGTKDVGADIKSKIESYIGESPKKPAGAMGDEAPASKR